MTNAPSDEAAAAPNNPVARDRAATMYKNVKMILRVVGDDMSEEQTIFQAYPGGGHVLWYLGHVAWTLDAVILQPFGRQASSLPSEWTGLFGAGTQAVPDASKYPPIDQLKQAVNKLARQAAGVLSQIPDAMLPEKIPAEIPASALFPTYDIFLSAMGFHKAYHAGQIAYLRRMQGLPSLIAPPPNLTARHGVQESEAGGA